MEMSMQMSMKIKHYPTSKWLRINRWDGHCPQETRTTSVRSWFFVRSERVFLRNHSEIWCNGFVLVHMRFQKIWAKNVQAHPTGRLEPHLLVHLWWLSIHSQWPDAQAIVVANLCRYLIGPNCKLLAGLLWNQYDVDVNFVKKCPRFCNWLKLNERANKI